VHQGITVQSATVIAPWAVKSVVYGQPVTHSTAGDCGWQWSLWPSSRGHDPRSQCAPDLPAIR